MRRIALALMLLLSGCVSSSYMGIPLAAGQAAPAIQELAMRARGGDKRAQLDLGIRFEEGNGVSASRKFAKKLYAAAARDKVQRIVIYSPPVNRSGRGMVLTLKTGVVEYGLSEARERSMHLKNTALCD